MVKVAIDAGHGGYGVTPGKRTPNGEFEWNFNDKVVTSAIRHLKAYKGVEILRLDDASGKTDVSLTTRTNRANAWGADVLISDHHNAYKGVWGGHTGTETYTYVGNFPQAEKLARLVHGKVVKAYGLHDRGLKKADFHMLRESKMPAILIEGGYMDSVIDIKRLRDDNVLEQAGKAIAEGVAEYFGLEKKADKADKTEPDPKQEVKSETVAKGRRLESKVDGLRFYRKPSWADKDVVGHVNEGVGFPTIVRKLKVENGYQYEVKNSKGVSYYITASSKYVKVEGDSVNKPNKPKPKPSKRKKYVYLPQSAATWRTYNLGVQPVKKNSDWSLTPARYGGLKYEVLDEPYPNVVTIETGRGKRNIYVAPSTGAVIK